MTTKQLRRFENKVALVTGGRSGIGQSIARRLRDEGASVITAQRGMDEEFDWIATNFSDSHSPVRIVTAVIARACQLDVVINNAGMMQEASIEEMSVEDWQLNLSVNLTAPFLLIQAALPYLRQTKGSIVNTGSTEGIAAPPSMLPTVPLKLVFMD